MQFNSYVKILKVRILRKRKKDEGGVLEGRATFLRDHPPRVIRLPIGVDG